jgi:uncharacterized ion transporter superfamily protein YfcC
MAVVLMLAAALTYALESGRFERRGSQVVAGSFTAVPKQANLSGLMAPGHPVVSSSAQAHAASFVSVAVAVPTGIARSAALITMVLFGGGMFGVLQRTGVLDAAIGRLIAGSRGRRTLVTAALMTTVAMGSSFLGLMSEYLAILGPVRTLMARMGVSALHATAAVVLAAKIGFLASVTNPLPLLIAQPLVGVAFTSGMATRLAVLGVFLPLALAYLVWFERRNNVPIGNEDSGAQVTQPLTWRHVVIVMLMVASVVAMVLGTTRWGWGYAQIAALYGASAAAVAIVGNLEVRAACDAFIAGVQNMVLPVLLIGMARAVEIVLSDSLVLDRVIFDLSAMASGATSAVAALGIAVAVALLGVLLPSISGKAMLSLPVLAPVGQLAGVPPDSIVLAFLLGSGLTNLVTPTSGLLLAFLAAGGVGFMQWLRFVAPLGLLLAALASGFIVLSVTLAR